jgi:alpha-mannosidase
VSLLNDCKYGHEAFDGMLALTLLRGPTNPDPESDQEEHRFVYALYPHTGTWREGRTYDQALDLNVPALAVVVGSHGGPLPARKSLLTCAGEYVTLEALKQAETSGHVILRLVERYGRRGTVKLTLPWPLAEAFECNLLEEEDARVPFDGAELVLEIKPYEIRTLKLKPARTAP